MGFRGLSGLQDFAGREIGINHYTTSKYTCNFYHPRAFLATIFLIIINDFILQDGF